MLLFSRFSLIALSSLQFWSGPRALDYRTPTPKADSMSQRPSATIEGIVTGAVVGGW
jgi:hypothetical protein